MAPRWPPDRDATQSTARQEARCWELLTRDGHSLFLGTSSTATHLTTPPPVRWPMGPTMEQLRVFRASLTWEARLREDRFYLHLPDVWVAGWVLAPVVGMPPPFWRVSRSWMTALVDASGAFSWESSCCVRPETGEAAVLPWWSDTHGYPTRLLSSPAMVRALAPGLRWGFHLGVIPGRSE